ncbi:uncharacterized protein LOC144437126 [Glandiceps talaboti]
MSVSIYQAIVHSKDAKSPKDVCQRLQAFVKESPTVGNEVCLCLCECLLASAASRSYLEYQRDNHLSLLTEMLTLNPNYLQVFDADSIVQRKKLDAPSHISRLYPTVFFRVMELVNKEVHHKLLKLPQFIGVVVQMYNKCVHLHTSSDQRCDPLPVNVRTIFPNQILSLQFMTQGHDFVHWCINRVPKTVLHTLPHDHIETCDIELKNAIMRRMR